MSVAIRLLSVLMLLGTSWAAASSAPQEGHDPISRLCDLGITLALSGRVAGAESVFVSILSRSPRDARALNDLGNLRLWRGEPDVAMEFYRAAGEADTTDAGIALNEAVASLFEGDEDQARERAEHGVQRAGGFESAARLLGIPYESIEPNLGRGADRTRMSREQALMLLRAAAHAVPADSTASARAPADTSRADRRATRWRSAGARGSDSSDVPVMVYWKY